MNQHLAAYLATQPAKTPEEEAALTSFLQADTTAEEAYKFLLRHRYNTRRLLRRAMQANKPRPLVIQAGSCIDDVADSRATDLVVSCSASCPLEISATEWRLLQMRAAGYTQAEIGAELNLTRVQVERALFRLADTLPKLSRASS